MKQTLPNRILSRLLLLWLLLGAWTISFAQGLTVSGTITAENGEALIGVNILIKNTGSGTITDIDGKYQLNVKDPYATLVISYVGYTAQEISIQNRSTIDVVLTIKAQTLNEVVVVGYGTQRKSDVTGSVSTVKSEELEKIPTATVEQALQGKVAGVQVTLSSGRPGDKASILVRGVGTLNNADPIYVVDGLILDDISFLNARDVESIEVLKDASATAIYGSRGANGVIMVTTKKGKRSEKTKFSVNAYYGQQQLAKKISLANGAEYAQLANEAAINEGRTEPYADPTIFGTGTDWQDVVFQKASMQNFNFSANGGNDKILFNLSADIFKQDGIARSSYFNRYSFRANNEYKLASFLKVGHNLVIAYSDRNNEPGGLIFHAYTADPTIPVRDSLGKYGNTTNTSNVSNPAAELEYNSYNRNYGYQTTGNAYADLYFLKNFTFHTSLGFNMNYTRGRSFTPEFFVNDKQQNPESVLSIGFDRFRDIQWENTLNYDKQFGKNHHVTALAGITTQEIYGETFGASRKNLIGTTEDFYFLDAGDEQSSTNYGGVYTFDRYLSYLGRLNYAFKDRYLFTASIRSDGSSKFGKEKRYGYFPSLAVAWRIIEEPFMKNQKVFNNLKFRASWGITGNDKIGSFQGRPVVTNNLNAVFGPAEDLLFGATIVNLSNPFIQWETVKQSDAGLEFGVLNNRLSVEVDYYNRVTKNILTDIPIPGYVGSAGNPVVNAASVQNKGWDFTLNWRDKVGTFNYNIGIIASTVHNEVLELGQGKTEILNGDLGVNGILGTRTTVGDVIGGYYGYKVAGIYQNEADILAHPNRGTIKPGDLLFVDVDGNDTINTQDRTYLGSPIPKFIYGFNLGFNIGGFDVSADFNGVYGNKIINAKKMARFFGVPNFESSFLDRWHGEGTSNLEPRVTNGNYPNYEMSDRFLEDGSFFRLRNLQIGYTLPDALMKKARFNQFRIYVSATNLKTWSKYSGYTPEVGGGNALSGNIDRGVYPVAKTILFGINTNF